MAQRFKINAFQKMAQEVLDSQMTESEFRNEDITEVFYRELEQHIIRGELLNININGLVAHGKSTEAIQICLEVKDLLRKHRKVDRPMTTENICRDQGEYAALVKRRPGEFENECDIIDEWSDLEETGFSSSILDAWLSEFSNTQAQRFYHRIACSPTEIVDKNTDILLECVDGENGFTFNYLRYRYSTGGGRIPVLLGYVIIDVRETLAMPLYKEYRRRKKEKWALRNKYNIQSVREMELAGIILDVFGRLKAYLKFGDVKPKAIKSLVKVESDKYGAWFSVFHKKDICDEIEGIADMYSTIINMEAKIRKAEKEGKAAEAKELGGLHDEAAKGYAAVLKRLETLRGLWDEYKKIG